MTQRFYELPMLAEFYTDSPHQIFSKIGRDVACIWGFGSFPIRPDAEVTEVVPLVRVSEVCRVCSDTGTYMTKDSEIEPCYLCKRRIHQ